MLLGYAARSALNDWTLPEFNKVGLFGLEVAVSPYPERLTDGSTRGRRGEGVRRRPARRS